MKEFGISCDFVGHPISSIPTYNENELSIIRRKFNIENNQLLLVVLPGSRIGEIKRLLPIFLKSLEIITTKDHKYKNHTSSFRIYCSSYRKIFRVITN